MTGKIILTYLEELYQTFKTHKMKEILNGILQGKEVKIKTDVNVELTQKSTLALGVMLCCVIVFWGVVYYVIHKKTN